MPRLHYYFYGFAIAGTVYGVIYKKLYLPYTTHQREMELVLEAEKFVSQQLLQRAERLYRQVGVAAPSELPALMANTYGLFNEFEATDCQSSVLPKSLYVSRLNKIRERCGLMPFYGGISANNDHGGGEVNSKKLTFLQQLRITTAYTLYWFLYRFSPIVTTFFLTSCSNKVQEMTLSLILSLLNFPSSSSNNVISIESLQEEDNKRRKRLLAEGADSIRKDTVFESDKKLREQHPSTKPKKRDDEITLDDTTTKTDENEIIVSSENNNNNTNVINIAHVSHWIEEVLVRYSLVSYFSNNNVRSNNNTLIIRRADDEEEKTRPAAVTANKNPDQIIIGGENDDVKQKQKDNFTAPFLCHGYPWYDKDFVEHVIEEKEKEIHQNQHNHNNDETQSPLVLIRPITVVSGLNKILWFDNESDQEKQQKQKLIEMQNKKRNQRNKIRQDLSVEEQLALAETNNSTLLSSPNDEEEKSLNNDNNNQQATTPQSSYDDLIRRRRTLVNPTRVKEEAEAAEREKALTELLYKEDNKDSKNQDVDDKKIPNENKHHDGDGEEVKSSSKTNPSSSSAFSKPRFADHLHVWNNTSIDFEELDQQEQELRQQQEQNNNNETSSSPAVMTLGNIVSNNNEQQEQENNNKKEEVNLTQLSEENYKSANQRAAAANQQKKNAIIRVNIGKPCVPHEVWPCILRQFSPEMES